MGGPEEKSKGFTITDRRSFTGSGEPRKEPGPPAAEGERSATAAARGDLPPVDFPTFLLSLASSALLHLGEAPDGEDADARAEKNLPLAKHSIDILSLMQEKTRGNLSATESQLLENLLFDLRLRYVEAAKSK